MPKKPTPSQLEDLHNQRGSPQLPPGAVVVLERYVVVRLICCFCERSVGRYVAWRRRRTVLQRQCRCRSPRQTFVIPGQPDTIPPGFAEPWQVADSFEIEGVTAAVTVRHPTRWDLLTGPDLF